MSLVLDDAVQVVDPHQGRRSPTRRSRWILVPVLIGLLAFGVRTHQPGPTTQTIDEALWLQRTERFLTGFQTGDLDDMTASWEGRHRRGFTVPASTMPGVTTMWAGSLGRGLAIVGDRLGISEAPGEIKRSPQTLRAARIVVSAWCALALGALVALLAWLVGRRAAVVTGVLLAVEPFVVGHGHLLHTDALVAATGAVAIVALMVALWGRRPGAGTDAVADDETSGSPTGVTERAKRWLLVLAGIAGGLCVLTKLNAFAFIGPAMVAALVIEAIGRRHRRPDASWQACVRPVAGAGAVVAAVMAATFVVAWPALWVDPTGQVRALQRTLNMVTASNHVFFMGSVARDPGARFYVITTIFRMSPWLLVGFPGAVAVLAWTSIRRWRDRPDLRVVLTILAGSVAYFFTIARTPMKYDRYVLPLWTWMALAVAIVVVLLADRLPGTVRRAPRPVLAGVGVAVVALLAWSSVSYAPYAHAYVDPLLGGQGAASQRIPLGWGEGLEQAGTLIEEEVAPGSTSNEPQAWCNMLRVWWFHPGMQVAFPCVPGRPGAVPDVDFFIRYVSMVQRGGAPPPPRGFERVRLVRIGGYPYVEVWVNPEWESPSSAGF